MSTTTSAGPTGTEGPEDRDDANAPDAQVIELRKPGTDQHTGPDAGPDAVPRVGGDETGESAESHYDVTLDEEPTPGGGPVDVAAGPAGSQPIIPSALHGWANIKATVRHAAALTAYRAGFHAVRSPWYGVQALWWSLVGLFRGAGRVLRWWWLAEQTGLRQAAADANDPQVWFKLHREVKATRAWRFAILAAAVIAAAILVPLAYSLAPWWVTAPVVGLAVAGLGPDRAAGGSADHRHGHGDAAAAPDQRRHRAARLLRRRARQPGQAEPAGRVRVADVPRRVRHRLARADRPAVREGLGRRGQGQGRDRVRAGRVDQPGVPHQGRHLQPPAHAVRRRPRPSGHPGRAHTAAGLQGPRHLDRGTVRAWTSGAARSGCC